jgi:tRNA-binding protein
MADFNKFLEIDIRAGTIIDVQQFPEARKPAFKLEIDFGHLGTKKSSAQITELYDTEALLGKQILAVVNFPP